MSCSTHKWLGESSWFVWIINWVPCPKTWNWLCYHFAANGNQSDSFLFECSRCLLCRDHQSALTFCSVLVQGWVITQFISQASADQLLVATHAKVPGLCISKLQVITGRWKCVCVTLFLDISKVFQSALFIQSYLPCPVPQQCWGLNLRP